MESAEIWLLILFLFPDILEWYFHDVIFLVNNDAIFTLNNVNIEEFYFWDLLEGIVKESVKFLC